jgi:hypothetical protein
MISVKSVIMKFAIISALTRRSPPETSLVRGAVLRALRVASTIEFGMRTESSVECRCTSDIDDARDHKCSFRVNSRTDPLRESIIAHASTQNWKVASHQQFMNDRATANSTRSGGWFDMLNSQSYFVSRRFFQLVGSKTLEQTRSLIDPACWSFRSCEILGLARQSCQRPSHPGTCQ